MRRPWPARRRSTLRLLKPSLSPRHFGPRGGTGPGRRKRRLWLRPAPRQPRLLRRPSYRLRHAGRRRSSRGAKHTRPTRGPQVPAPQVAKRMAMRQELRNLLVIGCMWSLLTTPHPLKPVPGPGALPRWSTMLGIAAPLCAPLVLSGGTRRGATRLTWVATSTHSSTSGPLPAWLRAGGCWANASALVRTGHGRFGHVGSGPLGLAGRTWGPAPEPARN